MSTAFKLFDRACWGTHPLAQPVIGSRANIERFTRDDLVDHVAALHGANLVVAVAGPVDAPRCCARPKRLSAAHAARASRTRWMHRPGTAASSSAPGRQQPDAPGAGLPGADAAADDPTAAWWLPRCWARA
jgi:hypothetical protein